MTKSIRLPHHQLGGGDPEIAQRYPPHTCPAPCRRDACLGSALGVRFEMEVPVPPVANRGALRRDTEGPPEATAAALDPAKVSSARSGVIWDGHESICRSRAIGRSASA